MNRFGWLGRLCSLALLLIGTGLHAAPQAETATFYYTDSQGTVLATADAAGNVTSSTDYRPYGSQARSTPTPGPGYTCHVYDPDTGLLYVQARYYEPATGRFLSTDAATADAGSIAKFNRYSYGANNPVSNVDPDGRNTVTAFRGLLYETGHWISGQGFDGSHLAGALQDGYNGEGAGVAASAFQDVTSFAPLGTAAKGVQLVRAGVAGEEVS